MSTYTRRGALAATAGSSACLATVGLAAGRAASPTKLSPSDHISIVELVNRFYYAIDHRNPTDFASAFVADGTFVVRDKNNRIQQEVTGHVALEKLGVALSPRHFISNFIIEPQQDDVRVRFSILKLDIVADPTAIGVTAEGDCIARRITDEWKLVRFDHLFDTRSSLP